MKQTHKKYIRDNIDHKTPAQIAADLNITEYQIKKFLQKTKYEQNQGASPDTLLQKPLNSKFVILSHILIIALGFTAYTNSLNGKFLYDDSLLIETNPSIKNPSEILHSFKETLFKGVGRSTTFYRPLQMASYVINYMVCQLDVRGYHLVNILLHIAVALSIFWLVFVLFNNNILALITTALFVVHPIHTEAISYISGRCDPLASLFILLFMISYIKILDKDSLLIKDYFFLLLFSLGAFFSKETSIILPVLILLYHFTFRKKIKTMPILVPSIITIFYIYFRLVDIKSVPPVFYTSNTLPERIPGLFVAILKNKQKKKKIKNKK
jgi:hypothetical protein